MNDGIEPDVLLANIVTMQLDEWQMVDDGRQSALCDMLVPVIAKHLAPLLAAARAEGYAAAREQAAKVVEIECRLMAIEFTGIRISAAIRAMQDGAVDEGHISIGRPDAVDDVLAFVDTGSVKP